MTLAVLLRNCPHNASATSTTLERYALQADSVTIQGQKAPLQIGVAKNIQLMDLGSTHLLNDLWDAHARTHLVWMIASFFLIFILGSSSVLASNPD